MAKRESRPCRWDFSTAKRESAGRQPSDGAHGPGRAAAFRRGTRGRAGRRLFRRGARGGAGRREKGFFICA